MYVAVSHGSMAYRHVGTGGSPLQAGTVSRPPTASGKSASGWWIRRSRGGDSSHHASNKEQGGARQYGTSTRSGAGTPRARGGGRRACVCATISCPCRLHAAENLPIYLSAPLGLGGCLHVSSERSRPRLQLHTASFLSWLTVRWLWVHQT